MILPAQVIRAIRPLDPFCERTAHNGMTFGLGPAGYDVRIAESITAAAGQFVLASTVEHFDMPNDVLGQVCDKSTWARRLGTAGCGRSEASGARRALGLPVFPYLTNRL